MHAGALYYHLAHTLNISILYTQVPSRDLSMTPEEALKHFQHEVPTLGLLGTPQYIDPNTPYTVDAEVQLVCKYLKALKIGGKKGIDRLYREGKVHVLPVTTKESFLNPNFIQTQV